MGFLDKVKSTAQTAVEKAQEGAKQGQEKIQEARAKRSADAVLRDLGAAIYLDRTGRGTPQLTSEIERLMAELREQEERGTVIEPPVASPAPEPEPAAAPAPAPEPAPAPAPEPAPAPAPEPASAPAPTVTGGDGIADPAAPVAEGPGPAPASS